MDGWMKKIRLIYTLEFYLAIKNEIVSFAGNGHHHVKANKPHSKFNLGGGDMKLKRAVIRR